MDEFSYFEYELTVQDDDNFDLRCGVVAADSYSEVTANLERFYGDTIVKINKITCVGDTVYEFNATQNEFQVDLKGRD